jgi:hypothetical protein
MQQLQKLEALHARQAKGEDLDFIQADQETLHSQIRIVGTIESQNDMQLPEPEKPPKYSAKNQAEWETWVQINKIYY